MSMNVGYLKLLVYVTVLCALATPCRAQTRTDWKLEDDRQHLTVTFLFRNPTPVRLNVSDVEELLKRLGEFRTNMLPEIPQALADGTVVTAISNPDWRTELQPETGATLLHVRDQRYGWLTYAIPRAAARKLASLLQEQVSAPSFDSLRP
jgi:hypothetical protein